MPVIRVEYDDVVVTESEATAVCKKVKEIVENAGFREVFVYGNSSYIKVNIAPLEIWVEASAHKISDADALAKDVRNQLSVWKSQTNFPHKINLTIIPMQWSLELEI
jgi:hypothetical protein